MQAEIEKDGVFCFFAAFQPLPLRAHCRMVPKKHGSQGLHSTLMLFGDFMFGVLRELRGGLRATRGLCQDKRQSSMPVTLQESHYTIWMHTHSA